jgi:ribulose-phosphate 3-epimerase
MLSTIICPTITAFNPNGYEQQMQAIEPFASRVHIDLMDGEFAPSQSPDLDSIWWPTEITADIHLMYERPEENLRSLIKLKPNLVIIHYEADVNYESFAAELKKHGIKAGLALLQTTSFDVAEEAIAFYDHILIFSGKLGYHGGEAQLNLLDKATAIKQKYPQIELAWDGGINDTNAMEISEAGVDVLNVGGFIQKSDDPWKAYAKIEKALKAK